MERMIERLFIAMEQDGGFDGLDKVITEECNRRLAAFKGQMKTQEYEEVRDVIFSIYAIAKKASFEEGFKSAMKLLLECVLESRLT